MIAVNIKTTFDLKPLARAVDKASFRNFGHGAHRVMKDAKESIKPAPKEQRKRRRKIRGKGGAFTARARHAGSRPGTPPYTQRGAIRRAIVYDANKTGAVIGPRFSIIGTSGEAHEFGKTYKGQDYPERPFMYPALVRAAPRFASDWKGSIGAT